MVTPVAFMASRVFKYSAIVLIALFILGRNCLSNRANAAPVEPHGYASRGQQIDSKNTLEIEYGTPEQVTKICNTKGSESYDQTIAGCFYWIDPPMYMVRDGVKTQIKAGLGRIVIPYGTKYQCIYWHELRHYYEGDWHHGRKATAEEGCDWRPR